MLEICWLFSSIDSQAHGAGDVDMHVHVFAERDQMHFLQRLALSGT